MSEPGSGSEPSSVRSARAGDVPGGETAPDHRLDGHAPGTSPAPALPGADHARDVVGRDEAVMGTVFSFSVYPGAARPERVHEAIERACLVLHELDGIFSTWRAESPMSRIRRGQLRVGNAPRQVAEVMDLCEQARRLSRGWFDPWAMPGGVDPSGLVKGWAVERALAEVARSGVSAVLVNGGGDLAMLGEPAPGAPWRVGIRHPWRPDALACVLATRCPLATSGTYERGAHLVDPRSGSAAARAASATVTGPSLALADAFATALAVGGDDMLGVLADVAGYEGYLIRPDGTEAATRGMAIEVPSARVASATRSAPGWWPAQAQPARPAG